MNIINKTYPYTSSEVVPDVIPRNEKEQAARIVALFRKLEEDFSSAQDLKKLSLLATDLIKNPGLNTQKKWAVDFLTHGCNQIVDIDDKVLAFAEKICNPNNPNDFSTINPSRTITCWDIAKTPESQARIIKQLDHLEEIGFPARSFTFMQGFSLAAAKHAKTLPSFSSWLLHDLNDTITEEVLTDAKFIRNLNILNHNSTLYKDCQRIINIFGSLKELEHLSLNYTNIFENEINVSKDFENSKISTLIIKEDNSKNKLVHLNKFIRQLPFIQKINLHLSMQVDIRSFPDTLAAATRTTLEEFVLDNSIVYDSRKQDRECTEQVNDSAKRTNLKEPNQNSANVVPFGFKQVIALGQPILLDYGDEAVLHGYWLNELTRFLESNQSLKKLVIGVQILEGQFDQFCEAVVNHPNLEEIILQFTPKQKDTLIEKLLSSGNTKLRNVECFITFKNNDRSNYKNLIKYDNPEKYKKEPDLLMRRAILYKKSKTDGTIPLCHAMHEKILPVRTTALDFNTLNYLLNHAHHANMREIYHSEQARYPSPAAN